MPQNFYELVWIFIIYAFIGWCTEVAYAALTTGRFVNRGFLNGPYCPIYGCGVVIVVALLTPLKENLLILFAGSFVLTSALEYLTGFLLEKLFHNKWWDYSNKPFNLKGYVCLEFSIYWGLACTFIMSVIHPVIYKGIRLIPHVIGIVILVIVMSGFVVDCGITVATILKFNQRLRLMNELAEKIHRLSDEIGENIYENVTDVIEKSDEFIENHAELLDKIADTTEAAKDRIADNRENMKLVISENIMETRSEIHTRKELLAERKAQRTAEFKTNLEEKRKEYREFNEKYEKLFHEKSFGFKRLMKAFPGMTSRDQNETLQKYKEYFQIRKDNKKSDNK